MIASIISLLTAFSSVVTPLAPFIGPFIATLGSWIINTFISDAAAAAAAKQAFLASIHAHQNDDLKTVEDSQSYDQQVQDLKNETNPVSGGQNGKT